MMMEGAQRVSKTNIRKQRALLLPDNKQQEGSAAATRRTKTKRD
jgi:hypothetical protein